MDLILEKAMAKDLMLEKAMANARKAFDKTFEDEDLDPAYWCLDLIGWELSSEFTPLRKVMNFDLTSGMRRQDGEWKDED